MEMSTSIVIGFGAATLTTIAFVPQVAKSWRTKHTKDLSWGMLIVFTSGVALWLVYGIIIKNWPMIGANFITLILVLSLLILKIRYG